VAGLAGSEGVVMPDTRRALGQLGEELAADHVRRLGYEILERNYRCPYGEMDIIARDGQRLAFIEVRTRRSTALGTPEESVTPRKQVRLAKVARSYLQANGYTDVDWGIDVVAVELTRFGSIRRIELLRNAVTESA
jgi:putative endonuclease